MPSERAPGSQALDANGAAQLTDEIVDGRTHASFRRRQGLQLLERHTVESCCTWLAWHCRKGGYDKHLVGL